MSDEVEVAFRCSNKDCTTDDGIHYAPVANVWAKGHFKLHHPIQMRPAIRFCKNCKFSDAEFMKVFSSEEGRAGLDRALEAKGKLPCDWTKVIINWEPLE